ncbi:vWA domain-containing protein [Streptomyces catenulae]|uniref:VWA domain-containing protein n=1 Tax=Streptomyces catenulae TaxID=66875 RepID=A0ABV2Z525_9ACTN|nr:VWA domain-containing protein [Streptomyces catenulae]
MARRLRRWRAAALTCGLLLAAGAAPAPAQAARAAAPAAGGGTVMVLDSSASMAKDAGSGTTRIVAARKAVGAVADALPDGYPTGLRVYGADKAGGCDDTRLVRPVAPLDRTGLKQAVADVEPKGDAPLGRSLQSAAADLRAHGGSSGSRTILLVSDGEDSCRTPSPCAVAAELGRSDGNLRIDTVGFQVAGAARQQLECVAKAGNGRYYDAPDAGSLARQVQRAGQLSADGYRLKGERVRGEPARDTAPRITPGQYTDTIGPNEKRYYAVDLDGSATADLSATVAPRPGSAVDTSDALHTEIAYGADGVCDSATERFGQREGATTLASGLSRVPSESGYRSCDKAGRYWFAVERKAAPGSDAARWPLELTFHVEHPLQKGVTPAQSAPEYGTGGKDATLPASAPQDVHGGTGFNDARTLKQGVWRDRLLPAQTLWYKVPVGWGQQLRYDVQFANEPTVNGRGVHYSYAATQVYTPDRVPVGTGTGEFTPRKLYAGKPTSLQMGTVPVAWSNRYESGTHVVPVHRAGHFYLAVTLGAEAAEIARNPEIGVVLRVAVLGTAKSGPGADAGRATHTASGDSAPEDDNADGSGGGWKPGPVVAGCSLGVGVLLLAWLAAAYFRARRGPVADGAGPVDPRTSGQPVPSAIPGQEQQAQRQQENAAKGEPW